MNDVAATTDKASSDADRLLPGEAAVRLPVKSIRCDEARAVSHPGSVSTQTQLKWSQQQLIASQKLRQIILLTALTRDKRDAGRQLHMLLLFPGSLTVVRRRVPGLRGTFWSSPEQEVGLILRGSRSISGMSSSDALQTSLLRSLSGQSMPFQRRRLRDAFCHPCPFYGRLSALISIRAL